MSLLERGPAHGPGRAALGPAALAARARGLADLLPRARHAAWRASGGRARRDARRSRSSCWRIAFRASSAFIDGARTAVRACPARVATVPLRPIERDGRELAMLVYDASLDDDPELVGAVAGAAAIALDDARLQTESEDRLAELRASRERLVTAGDAERRRLERNLHDGAQQRLVSVALQLRLIQTPHPHRPRPGRAAREVGRRRALAVARGAARARARHPSRGAQPRAEGRTRLARVALARPDHGVSCAGRGAPARAGAARRVLRGLRGAGQRREVRARDERVDTGLAPERRGRRSRSPTTASAAPTSRPAPGSKGWPTASPRSTASCGSSAPRGRAPWSPRSSHARRDRRRQPTVARRHRVLRARRGHRRRRGGVDAATSCSRRSTCTSPIWPSWTSACRRPRLTRASRPRTRSAAVIRTWASCSSPNT